MPKIFWSGDEAVARGAWEAGCRVAAAYPGTPSTEILETLAGRPEINSRWTTNEKTALEIAGGAALGGVRALAVMKHVGLNVAADPLMTFSYTGVTAGLVVVSADDPGCHSSQNEQDNRHYAVLAKIPLLEPADSQESLDFTRAAFELSEKFDAPVLLRLTTRICHSRGLVEPGVVRPAPPVPYVRNVAKTAMIPAHARPRHAVVEARLRALEEYAGDCPLNRWERGGRGIGVVAGGVGYQYAREAFGDGASYLKLGLTHPLPRRLMADFARSVERLYVVEEGDPYLENALRQLGFEPRGKDSLPLTGELNAGLVRLAFGLAGAAPPAPAAHTAAPARPPALCPGCPHRGLIHLLGQRSAELMACGDIGCYALGLQPPLSGLDTCICMGSGFSSAIGFAEAFRAAGDSRRVFGYLGDSTFYHSGLTGLVDAICGRADVRLIIADNSTTAMTGHQANPGSGRDLAGRPAPAQDPRRVVLGLGLPENRLIVLDPLDAAAINEAIDRTLAAPGPWVILARRPCVLLPEARAAHDGRRGRVEAEKCRGCRQCLAVGCPALAFRRDAAAIDPDLCLGCGYCQSVCRFEAIKIFPGGSV
ncbi:MAG: 4Fe-4S binding protein [Candidatus Adiutrix sp.]|jgi:indolepyruvate ferredoxin oxidoreductase alpha subunit|nr:4Fe-4S binding protein [Candidatus Adiutrix sp.]